MYDISPIVVTVNDRPPSFLHFLVRMCAVIGGVFAITSKATDGQKWRLDKGMSISSDISAYPSPGLMDRWVHWIVTTLGKSS